MAEKYSSDLLRVVVAQIAQTIGYSNTQSAPVELLEDILHKFIQELARNLHSQAEHGKLQLCTYFSYVSCFPINVSKPN